jgi:hypothetical protein
MVESFVRTTFSGTWNAVLDLAVAPRPKETPPDGLLLLLIDALPVDVPLCEPKDIVTAGPDSCMRASAVEGS